MTTPFFPTAQIEPAATSTPLCKAQQLFNTLVKKIELLQTLLVVWRDDMPCQSDRHRREYAPLFTTHTRLRIELVKVLDRACAEIPLSPNERKKLRLVIPSITAELMIEQPSDAIKALHDKYSDIAYDTQNAEVEDAMNSMLGDVFGLDLSDEINNDNPGHPHAVPGQKERATDKPTQQDQHLFDAHWVEGKKFAPQADHEQQQVEAVQLKKSLQAVFRKLVAAFHPDRAPDDDERERRTQLMQRVNVAYKKKDLLQLLELQVQIELGSSKAQLGSPSDERLKHYNKILQAQSKLLMQALAEAQQPFRSLLGITVFAELSTQAVLAHMAHEIQSIKSRIAAVQHDLSSLHDVGHLKAWLRDYQIPKEPEFDEFIGLSSISPFGSR